MGKHLLNLASQLNGYLLHNKLPGYLEPLAYNIRSKLDLVAIDERHIFTKEETIALLQWLMDNKDNKKMKDAYEVTQYVVKNYFVGNYDDHKEEKTDKF